ncbi:hypothetical protein ACWGVR_27620 [Streptomyces xanthophaeus]
MGEVKINQRASSLPGAGVRFEEGETGIMGVSYTGYRPCTGEDQKRFLAVPGIVEAVTKGLQFKTPPPIQIVAEAVRSETGNPKNLQYLVMGGVDVESDEDNREGYAFVNDGQIVDFKPIVLPILT